MARVTDQLAARIRALRLVVFDFDGVFTDNTVWVSETGVESVRCWRSDGLGLRQLEQLGLELLILSTEENPVVTARGRKLRVDCISGCPDKRAELLSTTRNRGIALEHTAFMGNDINDEECLRLVGVPVVVRDAHPAVRDLGMYRTRARGGRGAVREFCDLVTRLRAG